MIVGYFWFIIEDEQGASCEGYADIEADFMVHLMAYW